MTYPNKDKHQGGKPFLPNDFSRRLFLQQALTLGAAGLLVACSGGSNNRTQAGDASTGATTSSRCEGQAELSSQAQAAREAVTYVDQSPEAGKTCANCRFFKQPQAVPDCGGCEIIQGAVTPEGYCTAWVATG